MPPTEQEPGSRNYIITPIGTEAEPRDIEAARAVLQSLGFEPQIVGDDELRVLTDTLMPVRIIYTPEYEPEKKTGSTPKFTDITEPDDYLVREHFEHYREMRTDFAPGIVLKAFSYMIDCKPSTASKIARRSGRDVTNPLPGIEVVTDRTQVGYATHTKLLDKYGTANWFRNYAIRAGSVCDAAEQLESNTRLTQRELVIIALAKQLDYQFNQK